MTAPVILALTSHGNAPYLMAASLAERLRADAVVIPLYYGSTQKQILLEDAGGFAGHIYLSAELGDLFRPLLLEEQQGRRYIDLAKNAVDPDHPHNAKKIEENLARLLEQGFTAASLDGSRARTFHTNDFSLVLNITLPIRVPVKPVVSLFTGVMSHIYGMAPSDRPTAVESRFIEETRPYAQLWQKVEEQFDLAFIPRIHALSHTGAAEPGVILTPPLASPEPVISGTTKRPSVLILPSGTRTDITRLRKIADTVPTDQFDLVTLNGIRKETDFPAPQFKRVKPGIFGDLHLTGVFSRGGWGTMWQCMVNEKPIGVVTSTLEDDPEMAHTIATLRATGLGVELRNSAQDLLNQRVLSQILDHLTALQSEDLQKFGEYALNGYGFVAKEIERHFSPDGAFISSGSPQMKTSNENGVNER
jgi:hypothetical protein